MTRKQIGLSIAATEAVLKGKNQNELKETNTQNTIKAAITAAAGMDMESFSLNIGCGSDFAIPSDAEVIGGASLTAGTLNLAGSKDLESFDSINTSDVDQIRLAAINVVNANYQTENDGIVELCATETIDANSVGKVVRALSPNITVGATNVMGQVIGGDKVSLISNLDKSAIFARNKLVFMPIVRTTGEYKTSDALVSEIAETVNYNGETVDTAPVLVGKKVNLRDLCSTSTYLTQFGNGLNSAVTLASDGGLKSVVLKVKGAAAAYDLLKLNVSGEKGAKYVPMLNGDNEKDFTLTFETTQRLKLSTLASSKVLAYTSASQILVNEAGENLEVVVRFSVSAKVNTDSMIYSTTASAVELVALYDNGNLIESTETRYAEIKAIVDVMTVHGVDPEHSLSNSNNFDNGLIIDIDASNYIIPVTFRAPVTFRKSLIKVSNEDIPGYLASSKIAIQNTKAVEVLNFVVDFIDSVATKVDPATGLINDFNGTGVGNKFIKPAIAKLSIDATKKATMKSSETADDIARYTYDQILNRAIKLFADTNLDKASAAILPNEKIELVITTGATNASYIRKGLELDTAKDKYPFTIKVVTSTKMTNRFIGTFKVGTGINELTTIALVERPDYIYEGEEKGINGGQKVTKIVPSRGLEINAAIFMDGTIDGILDAYKNA